MQNFPDIQSGAQEIVDDFVVNDHFLSLAREKKKRKKKKKKKEKPHQLFLGSLKGVQCLLPALIFSTICDMVSQKCFLVVLIILCVFKLKPPRLTVQYFQFLSFSFSL